MPVHIKAVALHWVNFSLEWNRVLNKTRRFFTKKRESRFLVNEVSTFSCLSGGHKFRVTRVTKNKNKIG